MAGLLATTVLTATLMTGWASQYDPGVFKGVVKMRQARRTAMDLPNRLPDVNGFIAVVDCSKIGQVWRVRPVGEWQWREMLVADCAGPHLREDGLTGRQWMILFGVVIEADYETALEWGTVGRGIKVVVDPRPRRYRGEGVQRE